MNNLLDFFLTVAENRTFKWNKIKTDSWLLHSVNSKFINIIITDNCNLSCNGCRGDIKDIKDYESPVMEYEKFVSLVNSCVDSGIEFFDLTPVIGETLLIKDIHKYLDYLESHESVVGYLITTNGTIDKIPRNHKKLHISLSLYGSNITNFKKFTNSNLFEKTKETIRSLLQCDVPIEITLRNKEFIIDMDKDIKNYIYTLLTKANVSAYDGRVNDNRGGAVNTEVSGSYIRKGLCPCGTGSGGAIRNDGKYYYCAFNDLNRKSIIGELSEGISQLRKNKTWVDIINDQKKDTYKGVCESCTAIW